MADDNDKYIIELHRGMGQLEGQVKALISVVESGFKQTREAQAQDMKEMRRVNSDQWEIIEKNRADSAGKDSEIIRDCSNHRVKQARSSAVTGGGSGGVVFIVLEGLKWFFKGQWIGG